MMNRRQWLKRSTYAGTALVWSHKSLRARSGGGIEVNDVQSQLNATQVRGIVSPQSSDDVQAAIQSAIKDDVAVSVCGGRHAMGGQQFGKDTILLDTAKLNRVLRLDKEKGLVTAEGGTQWPELIQWLLREQVDVEQPWVIREKQTGVDRVSLAGSLSSNVHGRGLRYPPIVADVEEFVLVDALGHAHTCSRRENPELFSLVIGGYGLFGIIAQVTLRLVKRTKIRRAVEIIPVKDLVSWVDRRLNEGFLYGDCQYSTDLTSEGGDHPGVFSCYQPIDTNIAIPENQKSLSVRDWAELYVLARTDKKKAFQRYSDYYKSTNGQIYWSDTHQLAGNFDGYRQAVDKAKGTEMITEAYVSRDNFVPFLGCCRQDFLVRKVDMTYGTIRFIEKDTETFLPWAKDKSICIVCNLHVQHTEEGKHQAAEHFRRIIDRAIEHGGRFYLTYHRWANRKQIETCYPQFVDFLKLKRKYDPHERFQSDWYRHFRAMFADKL